MIRLTIALAMLLAAGCGGDDSGLGTHQLVGFTQARHMGDVRVFGLTRACQAEFRDSRVCTSREILETTRIPGGLEGSAWVLPTVVSTIDRSVVDASGLVLRGGPPSNCDQWKGGVSTGMVVDADGNFSSGPAATCNQARRVACCAPRR